MNVNRLIMEGLANKSRRMDRKFHHLITYYQDKWQEIYNEKYKDVVKIREFKKEFYNLKIYLKEDIIDKLWEKITTDYMI